MKKISILFTLLLFAVTAQITFAQSQKEKDRAAFISNTKLLEKKPFDPNAPKVRAWAFKWSADTDEVVVVICSDSMKLIPEKKNKFKAELLMQYTLAMAVFKLENPDKKNDEKAAQLAGIESMLRTYETMVTENEKAKNAELDALVAKRNNKELKALIDAGNCKQ